MTGTADTEAFEFSNIYSLETVLIPSHRPMIRKDLTTRSHHGEGKVPGDLADTKERSEKGQPVSWVRRRSRTPSALSAMLERKRSRTTC